MGQVRGASDRADAPTRHGAENAWRAAGPEDRATTVLASTAGRRTVASRRGLRHQLHLLLQQRAALTSAAYRALSTENKLSRASASARGKL
jgi:hypothetical protein